MLLIFHIKQDTCNNNLFIRILYYKESKSNFNINNKKEFKIHSF